MPQLRTDIGRSAKQPSMRADTRYTTALIYRYMDQTSPLPATQPHLKILQIANKLPLFKETINQQPPYQRGCINSVYKHLRI